MITCTRKLEFDSAHRLINHEGKCRLLHGHRYVVEATFMANELDEIGRVIDFSVIKNVLGAWIDEHLDHNTILCIHDKNLGDEITKITHQKIYYMEQNPTAENIAKHLLYDICPQLFINYQIKCIAIKVHETPKCCAEITVKYE
ncbi:MAG: 6-pyruvoyl trahydropterin synthase family protein [Alphaproteobacteria bacterium]